MPMHNNLGSFKIAKTKEAPQIIWNYSKAVFIIEKTKYQVT